MVVIVDDAVRSTHSLHCSASLPLLRLLRVVDAAVMLLWLTSTLTNLLHAVPTLLQTGRPQEAQGAALSLPIQSCCTCFPHTQQLSILPLGR